MNSVHTTQRSVLFGVEGELVLARVSVDPRHLEELLEALATLDFPVNPELEHRTGQVDVQFPAYLSHIGDVREKLLSIGLDERSLAVHSVLLSPATATSDL